MSALDLLFSFVVLAGVVGAATYLSRFVGALNQSQRVAPDLDRKLIDLLDRKAHLVEDLRDLELDYRMGKIAAADYEGQRARLEPQAVNVIRELEQRGYRSDVDAMLEEEEDALDEGLLDDELLDDDGLLDDSLDDDDDIDQLEEDALLTEEDLEEPGVLKQKPTSGDHS